VTRISLYWPDTSTTLYFERWDSAMRRLPQILAGNHFREKSRVIENGHHRYEGDAWFGPLEVVVKKIGGGE